MDYLAEQRKKYVLERYYHGYTVKELARAFGVSRWQIYRDLGAILLFPHEQKRLHRLRDLRRKKLKRAIANLRGRLRK